MKKTVSIIAQGIVLTLAIGLSAACNREEQDITEPAATGHTVLTVSLPSDVSRTYMGAAEDNKRKVFWSNGDRINLNGVASEPLEGIAEAAENARFIFNGVLNTPYKLLYPASFYKNANTVTLPSSQTYLAGGFATETEPLSGYSADGASISMDHLCAIVQLSVKKASGVTVGKLANVTFSGKGRQVNGDFTIDYTTAALTPAGNGTDELTMTVDQTLSESTPLDIFLIVPPGTYSDGISVVLTDDANRTMTKAKSSALTLEAGKLAKLSAFDFVPSPFTTELSLDDIIVDVLPPDNYNVTGRVVDNHGKPLEGVVVSDGKQCVRTEVNGVFYMQSAIAGVKFVHVSTPSGYLPPVSGGIPRFYKAKADVTPSGGIYNFGDFVLTDLSDTYANPDNFTILISADPQERSLSTSLDNVAYRSHRIREGLIRDLKATSDGISDRPVIGICLGDIIHEDMTLWDWYLGNNDSYPWGLKKLSFPTYHIIGNHDNDPDAADDDAGAIPFESHFGPRNYSFNLGGIHFVVLDNLIMKKSGSKLTDYDQGLTDDIWAWLQADMAFVPTTTKVMVCAHSPMFRQENGSERTNTAKHGGSTNTSEGGAFGYGDLFDQYGEVHAWAGHTHSPFNYIYSATHRHKNIQVHTLARSTGELWTNEYLANGTPRGFTIVNVDNGVVTWKFHPTKYQGSSHHGGTAPSYVYRDWNYNSSSPSIAIMKDTGAELNEDYQMHVYAPGQYADSDKHVYANVFLWDSLWGNPVFTLNNTPYTMSRIEGWSGGTALATVYDPADKEFRSFYKANYTMPSSYEVSSPISTLFKTDETVSAAHGTGTVTVTDRFGNTFTRTITW